MLEEGKKSFLIYLDAYLHILTLSMEQRGELFSALFWYAIRSSTERGPVDVVTAAAQFQDMEPGTRMAFCFMASNIARDTERWLRRKRGYQAGAEKRAKQRRPLRGVEVSPTDAEVEGLLNG